MQQEEFHPLELALPCLFLLIVYLTVFRGVETFLKPTVDPRAKMERVEVLKKRGHYQQALVYIQELTKDFPSNHIYWQMQADLYHRLQLFVEEARSLEKVFAHSSVPTDVCPQLGRAYELAGNREKGLDAHLRCLQVDPQNSDFLFYAGNAEEKLGHLPEALQKYDECLKVSHQLLDCITGKARIFLRNQDPQSALTLLSAPENAERVSSDSDALFARALSFRRIGRIAKAQSDLLQATQLAPNYFDLWIELAKVNLDLGQTEEAKANFKQALRIDPHNDDVKSQLDALEGSL